MKCINCNKILTNQDVNTIQRKINKNFYCNMKCYLEYVRREKIINYDFFEKINTEEKAYWLGFIYADGNVHKKYNCMSINLSQLDSNHLKKFTKIFNKKVKKYKYYNKYTLCMQKIANISLSSEKMKKDLVKNGIIPNKTYKDSDQILKNISENLIHHFIRGFFDGDGCISGSKNNITVSFAGRKKFLLLLRNIFVSKLGLSNTELEKRNVICILRWTGRDQISIMGNWLYKNATIFLERKKIRFEKFGKNLEDRGTSNYRGVACHKDNKKWLSSISYNKKRINLGYYNNEKDAAKTYDKAVIKYDKPLYKLNFKDKALEI
jgi:hypothetical protein